MPFVLRAPSLQAVAEVKIVTVLWNQPDIFMRMAQSFPNPVRIEDLSEEASEWKAIEEQVKTKVRALPLPQLCIESLMHLVKPLGMEIIDWSHYHNEIDSDHDHFVDMLFPQKLTWSMYGTIDYRKTAELMAKEERLDIEKRYKLACVSCLEDEARDLLESLSEERRREYINMEIDIWRFDHCIWVAYFTCTLIGDPDRLNRLNQAALLQSPASIHKLLFERTSPTGNRALCEHLFAKLDQGEKDQVLVEYQRLIFHHSRSPNTSMMYFWSLMNEEQRNHMLRYYIDDVLIWLLFWPMQHLFIEMAKRGWGYMDRLKCCKVLFAILTKIHFDYKDYDYCQLFWEIWRVSSAECKHQFLNGVYSLECLFGTKREEFVKLVLNEAPLHQIKALCDRYDKIRRLLIDGSAISDAALMECKEKAALASSNYEGDEEKRTRSQHVSRLIDIIMESKTKRGDMV